MLAQAATDGMLQLLGQAGIVGGILYWLTRSLIPKLQDEATAARGQFLIEAKETRAEFLAALAKERETNERHCMAIDELAGALRTLQAFLTVNTTRPS